MKRAINNHPNPECEAKKGDANQSHLPSAEGCSHYRGYVCIHDLSKLDVFQRLKAGQMRGKRQE